MAGTVGFEEFQEFLFMTSRDVDEELDQFAWLVGDAQVAQWLVEILSEWQTRAAPLPAKEHNAVLWRIGSNPLFLGWLLERGSELNFDQQCEIVHAAKIVTLSIPLLFGPGEPMETAYDMWWDFLISDVDEPPIGSVILDVLSELSLHPDVRVQSSALHGLGHLQHPGRVAAVDRYLQFHPDLASNWWIRQCRDGTVM